MKSFGKFCRKLVLWLLVVAVAVGFKLYIEEKQSGEDVELSVFLSELPETIPERWQTMSRIIWEMAESTMGTIMDYCSDHIPGADFFRNRSGDGADYGSSAETLDEADNDSGESRTPDENSDMDENPISASSYDSSDLEYYYFSQLSEKEQSCYLTILDGLQNMEENILVNDGDSDEIWEIFQDVLNDHPELYYVDTSYSGTAFLGYAELQPDYNCTRDEKSQRDAEIENALMAAYDFIGGQESDYMTIKRTFQYIIDTVDYVQGSEDNQNLYSALVNGESVCAGYSRAVQYLLQNMGIETLFVTGNIVDGGAHAWNIVKCNGNYYQVDATFGDRAFAGGYTDDMPELLHYDYTYLCCDDSVMYRNRTVDDNLDIPECTATDLNYYILQGIYFDSYDSYVQNSVISSIQEGNRWWRGKFSNEEAYQEMLWDINNGWYANQIAYSGVCSDSRIVTGCVQDDDNLVIYLWY